MPRIRSIRPEFWSDAKIVALTPRARLLYQALWNYCDDEGRGRYLPLYIHGFAFPHEPEVDIQALLNELLSAGRIVRYEVGGEGFFHVPSWDRHQRPNRPTKSTLPPPPDGSPRMTGALSESAVRLQGQDIGHRTQDIGIRTQDASPNGDKSTETVDNPVIRERYGVFLEEAETEVAFRVQRPSKFKPIRNPAGLAVELARVFQGESVWHEGDTKLTGQAAIDWFRRRRTEYEADEKRRRGAAR